MAGPLAALVILAALQAWAAWAARVISRSKTPADWLQKGPDYHASPNLSDEARDYLLGSAPPVSEWKGGTEWESYFVEAMQKLPAGVDVDDHRGTPIGEGESIGLVAAEFAMDRDQLALLPEAFRSGLFAPCLDECSHWPTLLRVSHTTAAGQELMRIAMKVGIGAQAEIDLTFTETLKSFPIANRGQLEAFSYSVKYGNGRALFKHPKSMAAIVRNSVQAQKYAKVVKSFGALGKDYHSLTPYLIGGRGATPGAMKYRLVPTDPDARVPYPDVPEGGAVKVAMREQLVENLSAANFSFHFEIQVATDPAKHPIDDASAEWDEATAPWVRMGIVRVPQQQFASPVTVGNVVGSGLWQGGQHAAFNSKAFIFAPDLSPHTPLGDINAFRADLYPHYDRARQDHLLGRAGGAPAKCPFAGIAAWLH